MTDEGPLRGPFPPYEVWEQHRQANGALALRVERWSGRIIRVDDEEWTAALAHHKAWEPWRKRQAAKQRAALRATLPHPNWQNRQPTCIVPVPGPLEGGMGVIAKAKQSPWQRAVRHCNERAVAFDGTDRRAVGYLYGACAIHLLRALYDDPHRDWYWSDGRPLDRTGDLQAELVVLALG